MSKANKIHPRNTFIPKCHFSKIHNYVVTTRSTNGTTVFLAYMDCGLTKAAERAKP